MVQKKAIEVRGNKKFDDVDRNNVNRGDVNLRITVLFYKLSEIFILYELYVYFQNHLHDLLQKIIFTLSPFKLRRFNLRRVLWNVTTARSKVWV